MPASRFGGGGLSLTVWSLAALGAGLAIGALGHGSSAPFFQILGDIVSPLGRLWISALQMTVLPLVVVYLLAAIVSAARETTSTVLAKMRRDGVLQGTRGSYSLDPEAMRDYAAQNSII